MQKPDGAPPANILIVDDTPANLHVLTSMLSSAGYRPRPTPSGAMALRAAESELPDLVLLDIRMPGMDGYEVCRRLKSDARLREVPVIFLSALADSADKLEAFRAGGVDYITKPFQVEEVQARVETHLRIGALQRALEGSNRDLAEANDGLRVLEALRDDFVHMLVHDMRTPLTVVGGCLDLLETTEPGLSAEAKAVLHDAKGSVIALIGMVSSVLDVSRMQAGKLPLTREPCAPGDLVRQVFRQLGLLAGRRKLTVAVAEPAPVVSADRDLVVRVLQNLIGNAIKFTHRDKGEIAVAVDGGPSSVRVAVKDNGIGIPAEQLEKVFEKFVQVDGSAEKRKSSSGLGLTFCKLAVEMHGGRIGVESTLQVGSTFWFELPLS